MKNKMILATVIALVMVVVGAAAVAVPDDNETAAAPAGTAISDEAGLVAAASAGGTYYLTADLTLTAGKTGVIYIKDGQTLSLDLNGHSISHDRIVFFITHGTFDVSGTGTIKETLDDQLSPICIKGSNTATDTNYTTVTIGKDVTLSGWAGIFITPYTSSDNPHAYGVTVNFNGKIIAPISGGIAECNGIYINGQIKDTTNCPIINISSTAEITVTVGTGIYAAGYAEWTIDGGVLSAPNGIEIKAGAMTINGGSFTATGTVSNAENNNGTSSTGYALAVVENKNYATPTVVTINGGSFNRITMIRDNEATGISDTLTIGCDLTVNQDATFAVTGHGQLTIAEGKTLTIASGTVLKVLSDGKIVNNGTLVNNGTITNDGVITNNSVLVNGASGTVTNTGTITNNESFVNNSTTVITGGTIVNDGVSFGVSATEDNGSSSTIKAFGNVSGSTITLQGDDVGKGVSFTVASAGTMNVDLGNGCDVSFTAAANTAYTITAVADPNAAVSDGETAYDIVVSGGDVGSLTITLPRSGSGTPYVNYVAPDGTVTAMKVESYTDTTVTFVTDHNSQYVVGVTEKPTVPPVSSYRVTITPGLGYSIACSAGNMFTLSADSSMNFRICATDGYQLMGVFASNAKLVNLGGGYYTISDVTANSTVTVQVQKVSSDDSNDDDSSVSIAAVIAAAAAAAVVAACAGYVYWRK